MNKVAHYRQAIWLAAGGPTLEQILRLSLGARPNVVDTQFEYKGSTDVQISARSEQEQGVGVYFTLFSTGQQAATVQNGGPDIRRRSAPAGEEYLRTGIHLMVEGNHAAYVAEGHTNDGQITSLLHRFFELCQRPDSDTQFGLQPRADRAQIERLIRTGVKSIDLGMSAFGTTVGDINDTAPVTGIGNRLRALAEELLNVGADNRTPEQIEAASEIQARVHLGYDGRNANHLLPVIMASIASNVTDNAGEFKIVTNDDAIITHDKLVIRREVNIEGDEIALDPDSAFAVLRATMRDWRRAGIFDS